MKEVQVRSWCDGEHAMKQPASREQEISLSSTKRFMVDLCESCYTEKVAPLEAMVKQSGIPVEAHASSGRKKSATNGRALRPGTGPEKCPVAGCAHGSTSVNGLKQHMIAHHPGQKLSDYS